jgi:23S rRNA U2552 (ribose-2'-O)-methylase RlmE/FtsJ
MNDLEKHFATNTEGELDKWKHYFEIYERHFSRFRGSDVHVMEIGVSQGGSLQMWKRYFGPKARIFGVDINPHCSKFEDEQITIFVGDQQDRLFLRSLPAQVGRLDILIDDGGHTMKQQIATYEELFPHVDKNGVYLCEDLHTSYWRKWGGGYRRRGSFIEYSKNLIDYLNAWHSTTTRLTVSDFTKCVHSLHYYDSVLVIEKRPTGKPIQVTSGTRSVPDYHPPPNLWKRLKRPLKRWLRRG